MKLLHFIVSHSLFIAFCAALLCFETAILLNITLSIWFYALIFLSTLCSYNFYWILSAYAFKPASVIEFIKSHLSNSILFLLAGAGVLVCLLQLTAIVPVFMVASLLTLLYEVPLLPFKALHFIRKAGLLKTMLLAFTWTFVTVYMPYVYAGENNNKELLPVFCMRFVFMLMLCIMFDARDTNSDKIRGLHSLATVLSAKSVKVFMLCLLALYLILSLFYSKYPIVSTVTTMAVTTAYFYSLKKQGYLFYYFIIDGLMLFSAIATFIASI